jgi:hypothetical protein
MRRAFLASVSLLAAAPLAAQGDDPRFTVDSGKVIRFDIDGVLARGRLLAPLSSQADSVLYCVYPGPPCDKGWTPSQVAWLTPSALRHLEVQVGTRAERGAWIGGVAGTLVTFLGKSLGYAFCECKAPSDIEVLAKSVIIGGLWGGGVGAIIGSGFSRMESRF